MQLLGLTNRQAAKLVGVTHKAIADAKKSGHLPALPDGSVAPDAVARWNASRRAPRGGYRPQVSSTRPPTIPADPRLTALVTAEGESDDQAVELLNIHGVFRDRATAELHRDSYVARLRQIEFEREAGKVVEVEHVAKVVGESLARVRTRLLAIPAEQAPRLFRCKTVTELQDAVLECITEAMNELTVTGTPSEP